MDHLFLCRTMTVAPNEALPKASLIVEDPCRNGRIESIGKVQSPTAQAKGWAMVFAWQLANITRGPGGDLVATIMGLSGPRLRKAFTSYLST